jgi:hypothetical protein
MFDKVHSTHQRPIGLQNRIRHREIKIQRCRYSIVERLCEGYNTSYTTAPKDTDEMKILVIGIWWSWKDHG